MGVPKFFRYISERYPCLSELVKDYQIPEFDNLYLDMNGIIHMCSHPNDFDPHFRISEEKIFKDIFHYLEILFRMIQPRKLFFMAVDGVAPRAKMNQQRGRRFRSAKEAEVLEDRAKAKGEKLPSEARFDSNCITPGTVFMARLHEQLKYFISLKMSTDKLWKNVKVILSGHETPGEGEHKIMDYIRWMKAQPDYDPNTRHCLYGLDADLIMLGLCTHEPHFSLLREEVKFGKKENSKRCSAPEETKFYLLHLSLMREYLDLEFQALKDKVSFGYDLESIIDDWVLMGFLVGNDFIPHLPDVHIATGALPMLYNAYIEVLPTLEGYINEKGMLQIDRFQKFMEKLSAFDIHQFKENYADAKYFEGKTGRKLKTSGGCSFQNGTFEESVGNTGNAELDALIKATEEKVFEKYFDEEDETTDDDPDDVDVFGSRVYDDDSDSEMSDLMKLEFHQQKKDYYRNKLEYGKVTQQVLRDQAEGYVRAIQWNLHYYYHGVASWSWFYPHHYAPYVSDICNFKDVNLEFELGEPFHPFEQLLAVLPAASKSLLPLPYQELMVLENSPIIQYYPSEFRTDLNGKKQDWEAVVLIPFIAEDLLLKAMGPCYDRLSPEEKKRNEFGPMMVYTYSSDDFGEYAAPNYFPTIKKNHAEEKPVWREELFLKRENIVYGLLPEVKLDVFFPGFPTFKHLPYTGKLKKAKVHVFDQASRGENMILTLAEHKDTQSLDLSTIAELYLGKDVYCGWPHLSEGRVIAVADGCKRYNILPSRETSVEALDGVLASQWSATAKAIQEGYMQRKGVVIGEPHVLLYTSHVEGRKYTFGATGKITLEKTYHPKPTPYALQTVVKDIAVHDPSFVQYKTLAEVFPPGCKCFLLVPPIYGALGEVVNDGSKVTSGRVKVTMTVHEEPNIEPIIQNMHLYSIQYMFGNKAAQRIGISSHVLSRITGTVYLITGNKQAENPSKLNIGLNLKFNKKNLEVPGYTKRENNQWLYSSKAVEIVKQYVELFPEVFEHISQQSSSDVYDDKDVFKGDDCSEKVSALTKWLKNVPCATVERRTCGSEVLDVGVVEQIDLVIKKFLQGQRKVKTVVMQVKPHTLFKSDLRVGSIPPDPSTTYMLFDRVVNVLEDSAVPLGLKGTLIGIHRAEKDADTMFDVYFDQDFPGGMSLGGSPGQSYRVSRVALINISHGQRLDARPKAAVFNSGGVHNGQRPTSAFASWNSPRGREGNQGQNWRSEMDSSKKHGSGFSNSSRSFNFPAPPNVNSKHMTPMQSHASQEQQLWKNLQMMSLKNPAQGNVESSQSASPRDALARVDVKVKKQVPRTPQKNAVQAPFSQPQSEINPETNVLKKILGIQEDHNENISLRPQLPFSQHSGDSAKKVSTDDSVVHSSDASKVNTSEDPCGRLLSTLQAKGTGVPAYTYFHQQHGSVRAELLLPDGRVLCGDYAANKHMAAENVARKALNLIEVTTPPHNISFGAFPPQQHYQQSKGSQFPPPPRPPVPPVPRNHSLDHPGSSWQNLPPPPFVRAPFPRGPPPFPPAFHDFSNPPQKKAVYQRNHQKPRGDFDGSNKRGHLHSNQRSQPRMNEQPHKYVEQKGSSLETKSFVPLQAMKQQRNAVKSAALLRREHEGQSATSCNATARQASPTETKQTDNSEAQGSKTIQSGKTVEDHSAKGELSSNVPNEGKSSSQSQSRSLSRIRKSRLAINFNVSSNDP